MKKVLIPILALVLALGLTLPMAMPVTAADAAKLVGHWQFTTDASDRSGYGNHGTLTGNASIVGAALNLDGDGDYVEVADSSSLDITSELTIEAWVQTTIDMAGDPDMQVVDKGEHASSTGYMLMIYDGDLYGRVNKAGNTACIAAYPNDGAMHHVAYTFKSGEQKLYIDGAMVASKSAVTTVVVNSHPLLIGKGVNRTNYDWTQVIDDVRIWSEALPQARLMDTSPPVVTITTPVNGMCYQSITGAAGGASDANIDALTAFEWSPSAIPTGEGTWTLTLTATDILGYSATDTVTYTIDSTLPVVTITAPVDGAFYLVGMVPAGAYTVVETNPYTVGESGWSDAVGEHTYTVTATDCAGNVGVDSVTYYVVDSYGTIGGQITQEEDGPKKKDWAKISYGGWAGLAGTTEYGELEVTFHNVNNDDLDKTKFVATSIDRIVFTNTGWNPDEDEVPAPPYSDYNKVIIWATGDLADAKTLQVVSADCEIKIQAVDTGEPGHPATAGFPDSIRIELFCDGSTYDYDSSLKYSGDFDWYGTNTASGYRHYIDAGNIQIVKVD